MVDLSAKDCRPIDRLGYRYEAALALMATKDETLFRGSLTDLLILALSPRHDLFTGPCESLISVNSRRRTQRGREHICEA